MKYLLNAVILAFAFGLFFVGVNPANAQSVNQVRKERREYRKDVRKARKDYRKDVRSGESYRHARREFRQSRRSARREFRSETGRPIHRHYYYRNGRRYYRSY